MNIPRLDTKSETKLKINVILCCLVVLGFLAVALWRLHTVPQLHSFTNNPHTWKQPSSLSGVFQKPIASNAWQFSYVAVENILLNAKQNESGDLVLDAALAHIIEKAAWKLPNNMKLADLNRVKFLVTQGLPGAAGSQLASVLLNFYQYQQAVIIAPASADGHTTGLNPQQIFEQKVTLQTRYMGRDVVQQLFSQQYALKRYLYARLKINQDKQMNTNRKKQALAKLQARYKLKAAKVHGP
jgi:hypothetical protein